MVGIHVRQMITLVTYGNMELTASSRFEIPCFNIRNTSILECEYVQFVDIKANSKDQEKILHSSDPANWFRLLKEDDVYAMQLHYDEKKPAPIICEKEVASRLKPVFGGYRWFIETIKPNNSDYWDVEYEFHREKNTGANPKPWRFTYTRSTTSSEQSRNKSYDLEQIKSQLQANLKAITEFTRTRQELDWFYPSFNRALSLLYSSDPFHDRDYADMIPRRYLSLTAAQLLATADQAWEFGGMGSWNDTSCKEKGDEIRRENLSDELYRLLITAIIAATNSSVSIKK